MDKPYPIRTGSMPVCNPPEWAQNTKSWPLRADFDIEHDVIDAPESIPAGSVRMVTTPQGSSWQTQSSGRF